VVAHPRPVRDHDDEGRLASVAPASHDPPPVGAGSVVTTADCPPVLQLLLYANVHVAGPAAPQWLAGTHALSLKIVIEGLEQMPVAEPHVHPHDAAGEVGLELPSNVSSPYAPAQAGGAGAGGPPA
jgi:hypothetical protein